MLSVTLVLLACILTGNLATKLTGYHRLGSGSYSSPGVAGMLPMGNMLNQGISFRMPSATSYNVDFRSNPIVYRQNLGANSASFGGVPFGFPGQGMPVSSSGGMVGGQIGGSFPGSIGINTGAVQGIGSVGIPGGLMQISGGSVPIGGRPFSSPVGMSLGAIQGSGVGGFPMGAFPGPAAGGFATGRSSAIGSLGLSGSPSAVSGFGMSSVGSSIGSLLNTPTSGMPLTKVTF